MTMIDGKHVVWINAIMAAMNINAKRVVAARRHPGEGVRPGRETGGGGVRPGVACANGRGC